MATLEDLEKLEEEKKKDSNDKEGDEKMADADGADDGIDPEILSASTQDIINRRRLLENDLRVMRQEHQRLTHEKTTMNGRIRENQEKIENNR